MNRRKKGEERERERILKRKRERERSTRKREREGERNVAQHANVKGMENGRKKICSKEI